MFEVLSGVGLLVLVSIGTLTAFASKLWVKERRFVWLTLVTLLAAIGTIFVSLEGHAPIIKNRLVGWANQDELRPGAVLVDREFNNMSLVGVDLEGANLTRVSFRNALLYGANLSEAVLREASLVQSDLSRARLIAADLSYATLKLANLRDASLVHANLRAADLTDADLKGADLSGAQLYGAVLHGANLSEVRGLTRARLQGVVLDSSTILPSNIDDSQDQ